MFNTDRDPTDQILTGEAVSAWLTTEPGDTGADQTLLAVLVEQGVITPEEAATANIHDTKDPVVMMTFASGWAVRVDEDGVVTMPR